MEFSPDKKPKDLPQTDTAQSPRSDELRLEGSAQKITPREGDFEKKPPDVGELIKYRVWQQLVRRFGRRASIAGLVFVFVCGVIWKSHEAIETVYSQTLTWISEHLPLPRVNPNVFTVGLVELQNDQIGSDGKPEMESDIADSLGEVKGISVLTFSRPPISTKDMKAGNQRARKYLKQSGAEVLIWGKVMTVGTSNVPKLYWTVSDEDVHPAKESDRYSLSQNLSLPPLFLSDLANVLRLLIVSQSIGFSFEQGHPVADQLGHFVEKVQQLLTSASGPQWNVEDTAHVRIILANALVTLGEQSGTNESFQLAETAYRAALLEFTRAQSPLDWARTENNLGVALTDLGENESAESGTTDLEGAVAAFRAALLERTRKHVPLKWAMTENNLGLAMADLGKRESGESGTSHLEEAVRAYRAALLERTRDRVPVDWASTQSDLAEALTSLDERKPGIGYQQQAVEALRASLSGDNGVFPLAWAGAQNNRAGALRGEGEYARDPNEVCNAIGVDISAWQVAQAVSDAPSAAEDARKAAPNILTDQLNSINEDIAALRRRLSSSQYMACISKYGKALKEMGLRTSPP